LQLIFLSFVSLAVAAVLFLSLYFDIRRRWAASALA
jgi:hypothetical protein